jgi:diguanylate cyclase (GGDEF)-like protein
MGWGHNCIAWIADVGDSGTVAGRALLEERYRALQRQIPLIYAVALTNFVGLYLATGGQVDTVHSPVPPLVAFVLLRLIHWVRVRNRVLPPRAVVNELRKTLLYAFVISIAFSSVALQVLKTDDAAQAGHVALFGSLAAVGCAYGLSSYPAAARIPLLFLGLPIAIWLIWSWETAQTGMGLALGVVTMLILRLLQVHNRAFSTLVESRSEISVERQRARKAEKRANLEKAKAKRIADTDPLTGLANRRAFLRLLEGLSARTEKGGGSFALAMVDLDGFKPINDTFGHATGDAVLQGVGSRLGSAVKSDAAIARTGGDEFAVLLPGVSTMAEAQRVGEALCVALQEPFVVDGREFRISGCCGLALCVGGDSNVTDALIRADTALYRAKDNGRAGAAVFSAEMDALNRRRVQIERALRSPETHGKVELLFQPIRDLATGRLRAFEALARWEHETLGWVPPSEFIPIAEQIDAIGALSENLLARAAAEAASWPDSVRLSFNLSAVHICTPTAAGRVLEILECARLDPARLQVEVTETALLVDFDVARENLRTLRAAGARIVLDDFGAGHASISYLREMQFDGIKLDGSLVASVARSVRGRRLLKGVLDLCAAIGVPCVAEHVETEEQLALLRELGCRDGQGYLIAHPLAGADAKALAASSVATLASRRAA